MTDPTGRRTDISIGGSVTGPVVSGDHNVTVWGGTPGAEPPAPEETDDLRATLGRLRRSIEADTSDGAGPALAKLDELEEAIFAEPPDLATMEHVRGWFARRFPRVSAAVGRVVLSPIVAKLVEAAGDELAEEFRRRFPM